MLTGALFFFNLGGIPGDIAQWAHWLRWLSGHRSHWSIFGATAGIWLVVTAWLAVAVLHVPKTVASVHRPDIAGFLQDPPLVAGPILKWPDLPAERSAALRAAFLPLGTELRDIRHKIEIVKSTRPHPHYSHGFQLPGPRWDEFYGLISREAPELYPVIEAAYTAAHHVNTALDMRRTRATPGATIGVTSEEDLDGAYKAAGLALDAIGEPRGKVWQSEVDRAVGLVAGDIALDRRERQERIITTLDQAITRGQELFDRKVTDDGTMGRWLADHMSWRLFVNSDEGELKAVLPLVDYHRVNDLSGTPDTVPVGEFDYDARHARSRVWIDRRLKNLVAVLGDYREVL